MTTHCDHFQCQCGDVRFTANAPPLFRALCHCTICQKFNRSAYADVLVFPADTVQRPDDEKISYTAYKRLFGVQRGICKRCQDPVIEHFSAPLFPALVMVPASCQHDGTTPPQPIMHMFYDKRIADSDDDLPKHHGFLPSQMAFMKHLRNH